MTWGLRERRVLVTHDGDHLHHAAVGIERAGIIFCRKGLRSIGKIIASLKLIHDVLAADEMHRRVEFI
ncbi:MAG: hypothetical protein KDA63_00635 [Planctomycetales bacterium]|nr:hypothetical protein [Planctomycetales bacterium]